MTDMFYAGLGGLTVFILSIILSFKITRTLISKDKITTKNALQLLRKSKVEEWNEIRDIFVEWKPYLKEIDFSKAYLPGVDLRQAQIDKCSFRNSNLDNANFTGATIINSDLTGASLR